MICWVDFTVSFSFSLCIYWLVHLLMEATAKKKKKKKKRIRKCWSMIKAVCFTWQSNKNGIYLYTVCVANNPNQFHINFVIADNVNALYMKMLKHQSVKHQIFGWVDGILYLLSTCIIHRHSKLKCFNKSWQFFFLIRNINELNLWTNQHILKTKQIQFDWNCKQYTQWSIYENWKWKWKWTWKSNQ